MKSSTVTYTFKAAIILACLSMFYLLLVINSALLTHKVVSFGSAMTLAGVLIVPFIFCTADIITELYGYKTAFIIIQVSFVFQLIFALVAWICIRLHSPEFWHGESDYLFVFGPILRMCFASYFGYIISSTLNLYIINKWRIAWRGKYFWLRSIGSSTAGELCYSVLIILFMQYGHFPGETLFIMMVTSYFIKTGLTVLISMPANYLVFILKVLLRKDGFDPHAVVYNPFKLA